MFLQCGGIIVDVNISDHSTIIGFSDYYDGAAPALLLNHTAWVTISYKQRSEVNTHSFMFRSVDILHTERHQICPVPVRMLQITFVKQ